MFVQILECKYGMQMCFHIVKQGMHSYSKAGLHNLQDWQECLCGGENTRLFDRFYRICANIDAMFAQDINYADEQNGTHYANALSIHVYKFAWSRDSHAPKAPELHANQHQHLTYASQMNV